MSLRNFLDWLRARTLRMFVAILLVLVAGLAGSTAWWFSSFEPPVNRYLATDIDDRPDDELVVFYADEQAIIPGSGARYSIYYFLRDTLGFHDGDTDGRVVAKDPDDGTILWQRQAPAPPPFSISKAPYVTKAGDFLIVLAPRSTNDDRLADGDTDLVYALDAETGETVWQHETSDLALFPGGNAGFGSSVSANTRYAAVQSHGRTSEHMRRTIRIFETSSGEVLVGDDRSPCLPTDQFDLAFAGDSLVMHCREDGHGAHRIEIVDIPTGEWHQFRGSHPVVLDDETVLFRRTGSMEEAVRTTLWRAERDDGGWSTHPFLDDGERIDVSDTLDAVVFGDRFVSLSPTSEGSTLRIQPFRGEALADTETCHTELTSPDASHKTFQLHDYQPGFLGGYRLEQRYYPLIKTRSFEGDDGDIRFDASLAIYDLESCSETWTSETFTTYTEYEFAILGVHDGRLLLTIPTFEPLGTEDHPDRIFLSFDARRGAFEGAGTAHWTYGASASGSPSIMAVQYPERFRRHYYFGRDDGPFWSLNPREMTTGFGPVRIEDARGKMEEHLGEIPWTDDD